VVVCRVGSKESEGPSVVCVVVGVVEGVVEGVEEGVE
jgi:hypothetical protein